MGHYKSNLRDVEFNYLEVFNRQEVLGQDPYGEVDADTAKEMLKEVARLAENELAESFADADRIKGLPIHIIHGALDWMFPIELADEAERALKAAGADVTYRPVADLSHTVPQDLNSAVLDWFMAA